MISEIDQPKQAAVGWLVTPTLGRPTLGVG
jgi:hypothetical protein